MAYRRVRKACSQLHAACGNVIHRLFGDNQSVESFVGQTLSSRPGMLTLHKGIESDKNVFDCPVSHLVECDGGILLTAVIHRSCMYVQRCLSRTICTPPVSGGFAGESPERRETYPACPPKRGHTNRVITCRTTYLHT